MKNTIRRLLAMAIALIMVFGTVPAFAAETGDTIRWYEDDSTEYIEATVTDVITVNDVISVGTKNDYQRYYYIINVENAGYYAFDCATDFAYYIPFSFENGVAHGYNYDCIGGNGKTVIYFEEGENLFSVFVRKEYTAVVSFEYLGDSIINVEYDDYGLQNLLIGCEVAEDHNYFQLERFDSVDITFSDGTVFKDVYTDRFFHYDAPLKEGENTGYLEILKHHEPVTFTAYPVSKYIESMEITNVEKLLEVKQNYLGEYIYPDIYSETVTVKFTDGTKIEVQQYRDGNTGIDFTNGHHYQLLTEYTETDDGLIFELGFNKHMFNEGRPMLYSAPCKVSRASLMENLRVLSREIRCDFNYISSMKSFIYSCKYAIDDVCVFFDYYL